MKRIIESLVLCLAMSAWLRAAAMPVGIRTLLHAHAVARQLAETDHMQDLVNVVIADDKAEVEESGGGYVVTAKGDETLTEADFDFGAIVKEAYKIEIAADGKSATVTLATPQVGVLTEQAEEVHEDEDDATGLLVVVDEAEISAKPTPEAGEAVGALPVKTYPGLWYQAEWGDDIGNLTSGEKVQATGGSLYLGVIKQKGAQGFYRLNVSER